MHRRLQACKHHKVLANTTSHTTWINIWIRQRLHHMMTTTLRATNNNAVATIPRCEQLLSPQLMRMATRKKPSNYGKQSLPLTSPFPKHPALLTHRWETKSSQQTPKQHRLHHIKSPQQTPKQHRLHHTKSSQQTPKQHRLHHTKSPQ